MSALGQKQTCAVQKGMSALPPIATSIAFFGMSALGQKRTSTNWASDGLVQLSRRGFLEWLDGCTLLQASQYLQPESGNLGSGEAYQHEFARRCLGNGRRHRMLCCGVSRYPNPTAHGQTA